MDTHTRKQIIAQEWMIDPEDPMPMLSRLQHRRTYSDSTLGWLVIQLNSLNRFRSNHYLKKLNLDPYQHL